METPDQTQPEEQQGDGQQEEQPATPDAGGSDNE